MNNLDIQKYIKVKSSVGSSNHLSSRGSRRVITIASDRAAGSFKIKSNQPIASRVSPEEVASDHQINFDETIKNSTLKVASPLFNGEGAKFRVRKRTSNSLSSKTKSQRSHSMSDKNKDYENMAKRYPDDKDIISGQQIVHMSQSRHNGQESSDTHGGTFSLSPEFKDSVPIETALGSAQADNEDPVLLYATKDSKCTGQKCDTLQDDLNVFTARVHKQSSKQISCTNLASSIDMKAEIINQSGL